MSAVRAKLLHWLLRYPLQRTEDLVLALEVSPNTIYRHLTRLAEDGLLEYVTPSLGVKTTCRLFYLSNAGLLVAAGQEHTDARALALRWGAHEHGILHLLPRIPMLVRLQNLVNALVTQAPAMLAPAGGYRAELTWHWLRDYQHTFLAGGPEGTLHAPGDGTDTIKRLLRLEADGALLFGRKASISGSEYYCALLFLDPGFVGCHDRDLIMQKLEAVAHCRASLELRGSAQPFPPLLVLTQTPRQCEVWQHCAAQVATTLHAPPLIGAVAGLPLQATADVVWTLPWQKLAVPASCRLRDLFTPLPKEALLPALLHQSGPKETPSPTAVRERMESAARPASAGHLVPHQPASAGNPGQLNPSENRAKQRRILKGDFARRSLSLAADNLASRNQHQELIALLSLRLSQRHMELLSLLYEHPLLATHELAILLNLQPDSVTRYLYELGRYACIEKYSSERVNRWHLADRGLRLIAAGYHCPLSHIAVASHGESGTMLVQRGLPLLKKSLTRTTGLYAFFTALHAHARETEQALLWWETGDHCEHHYQDHGQSYSLRPDAAFAYKAGSTRLSAWLEWEEGTTSRSDLAAKMQAYTRFVKAREWLAAGFQALPVLCIIVQEKKRLQLLAPFVAEGLADTSLLARMTTAQLVADRGPLAPIWSPVAPPKSRASLRTLLDLGNVVKGR